MVEVGAPGSRPSERRGSPVRVDLAGAVGELFGSVALGSGGRRAPLGLAFDLARLGAFGVGLPWRRWASAWSARASYT
jgi:hypothetical protein